jgi:hypothetical protein
MLHLQRPCLLRCFSPATAMHMHTCQGPTLSSGLLRASSGAVTPGIASRADRLRAGVSQQAYWTRSGATNPFAASLPLCTMLVLCKGHPLHVGPRHSHLTGSCGWVQIASRGQIGAAAESAPARGQSEHSPGPQRPGSPRGHPASSSLVSGPAQGHRNAEHHALLVGAGLGARLGGQVWGWDRRGTQKEGWVRHLNSSSGRCRTGVNQISRPSEVPLALYRVDRGASPRES